MPESLEDERWAGHRREHTLAFTDMERRLDEMNALRAQINEERGEYITRPTYELRYDLLVNRIGTLEQAHSNAEGRMWAIGAIGGALIVALELGLRILRI